MIPLRAPTRSTTPPEVLDVLADAALVRNVRFQNPSVRLSEFVDALSRATNLSFSVDPAIAGRRFSLFTGPYLLRDCLLLCAWYVRATWHKDGATYLLKQSPDDIEWEAKATRESEQREQNARREARGRTRANLDEALAGRGESPGAGDLFGILDAGDIETLLDTSAIPNDFFSATDNQHGFGRIVKTMPFDKLPPAAQKRLRDSVAKARSSGMGGPPDEIERCEIGIVAGSRSLEIAVLQNDGKDFWISPFDLIGTGRPDQIRELNDFSDSVIRALNTGKVVEWNDAPESLQTARISFPAMVDRRYLASLLGHVARETNIPVVAHDFWRTRYSGLDVSFLPPTETFPLADALKQIATVFGHRVVYKSGVLRASTLTPGLDLRAEPAFRLTDRLTELSRAKKNPTVNNLFDFAALSHLQLVTLIRAPIEFRFNGLFVPMLWNFPLLKEIGRLTRGEREQALSPDGLPLKNILGERSRRLRQVARGSLTAAWSHAAPWQAERLFLTAKNETCWLYVTGARKDRTFALSFSRVDPDSGG